MLTEQTDECTKHQISAVALTAENLDEDPAIWDRLSEGEYRVVYASPEIVLDPEGRFQTDIIRHQNNFMKNVALITVDECHVIWSWDIFRPLYAEIGKLRKIFVHVPFACLSATLLPNVAHYVHTVCNLKKPCIQFNLSTRRDDINLAVVPFQGNEDIDYLLHLIQDPEHIPKTLIYDDDVEHCAQIALRLKYKLALAAVNREQGSKATTADVIRRIFSDVIIGIYWSSIDDKQKRQTLSRFRSGKTRIVIGTDAFSLGINVPDVEYVYQWGVDNKATMEALVQKFGRGSRAPERLSTAITFANKKLLGLRPGGWKDAWKPQETEPAPTSEELDQPFIVPVFENRELPKFGLPITPETMSQACKHLMQLYKDVKNLKEAHKAVNLARSEVAGRGNDEQQKRLNPLVFWFIVSEGCRHRVLKLAFREPGDICESTHRGWCCESCALARGVDPTTPIAPGITMGDTLSYIRKESKTGNIKLRKKTRGPVSEKIKKHRRG